MKDLLRSYTIVLGLFCFLVLNNTTLLGQQSTFGEDINLKVKTSGKLLSPNKLILIVEVDIPEGWKLNVKNGYGSIGQNELDTLSLSLKFRDNSNCQTVERLKADRKPGHEAYYYEDVTFAQTMRINTKKLPLFIDAEIKLFLSRVDEKDHLNITPCCLLQVCEKRAELKTLKVGWACERREKVYLEDVMD